MAYPRLFTYVHTQLHRPLDLPPLTGTTHHRPRSLSLLSIISLSGGYIMLRSRGLTVKPRENGDYSVTVDRSGMRQQHI